MSVPNQASAEGGFSRWVASSACGSCVASSGANTAMTQASASSTSPSDSAGQRRRNRPGCRRLLAGAADSAASGPVFCMGVIGQYRMRGSNST